VAGFIYLCAFLGITASAFINMMGQSRLLYSLAKDGLFFETFRHLSPKTHVPIKGAWVSCIAICLLSIFLDVEELTFIISIENLFTFSITNCGLIALRFRDDQSVRHPNEKWAWYFMMMAFAFSISWGYQGPWPIILILGIAVIALIVKLH
jgi:APA family basic amino acid/polyamine antiporter